MTTQSFDYTLGGLEFDAVLVAGESPGAPTVLVFHGMEGRSDAQVEFCSRLAALGYRAVAVDLFGRDVTAAGPDACAAAMGAFLDDRNALRDRIIGVVDVIRDAPDVDAGRDGRHRVLLRRALRPRRRTPRCRVARRRRLPRPSDGAARVARVAHRDQVAVFHGWDDPFAPPSDVLALATELTERRADWQLHAYGHAMHAFMAPFANAPERGIQYDERTARRAWSNLVDLLAETFGD